MNRLPTLTRSTDCGYIYVAERGGIYKIGFSRGRVPRRVRDCGGRLILAISTGQQPASLEQAIHRKFAHKLTDGPQFKREWFRLDSADLEWLRGLADELNRSQT